MFMKSGKMLFSAALVAGTMLTATPAFAQATRTWVSGTGDDVNPCSRTAPCKTFAGAISKTAAGGEINCLDPAGYGAVTITKSLVIDCHFTEGGALAAGNGIVVNATASDVVVLRGLDIFGVSPPSNGVRILVAGAVHIEDSVIRRFNASGSEGVSFVPTVASQLYISNTTITENGTGTSGGVGGGIEINPGVGGSAKVVISHSNIRHNASDGIRTNSTNGVISLVIDNSDVSGNVQGVVLLGGASASATMITNSVIANNSVIGIVQTNGAIARVDNTTITGNGGGISGTQILSYGGNRLDGNPTSGAANDGAFNGAVLPRK